MNTSRMFVIAGDVAGDAATIALHAMKQIAAAAGWYKQSKRIPQVRQIYLQCLFILFSFVPSMWLFLTQFIGGIDVF